MAAACDPVEQGPVDYPIEGNFTISASYTAMVHGGGYGWRDGEQIGVFVTSEGVTQANLLYNPSDTSKVEIITGTDYWGDPYEMEDRSIIGDVELTPAAEAAGYKKGEHVIYAYTPYVEGVADFSAVPVADNASQVADENAWMTYSFGYAKTTEAISEFTSANISLGDFKPLIYPLTVSSIELTAEQAENFKNKKVTSVKIISTELDIALTGATVNLATGEITGTKGKEIVITFPGEGKDVEYDPGFPPYLPEAYFIPSVTAYANINPEADVTVRQEEYTTIENEETVTKYKDVPCLKGSYTVVYTIGGVEYTATTLSSTQKLAATEEYMAFPLLPELQ